MPGPLHGAWLREGLFLRRARSWVETHPLRTKVLILTAAFGGLTAVRTHGITRTFWLLGEQIRDWSIALRPFHELPLVGTPSTAGGHTLGPVYYWVLWLSRVTIGPWFDNLPHAGGIGISLLQSAADALFLYALWRRLGSFWLALPIMLLVASSSYDMALSAIVWNPDVALALTKVAASLAMLWAHDRSVLKASVIAACAWMALQAHSTAIFFTASMLLWLVMRPLLEQRIAEAFQMARAVAEVVLVLQVPQLVHRLSHAGEVALPGVAVDGVTAVIRHPGSLRFGESAQALARAMDYLLFYPYRISWPVTGLLLLLCGIAVIVARRRELDLMALTVVPLGLTVIGFSAWPRAFAEAYWFLTLMPAAALTLVLGLASPGSIALRRWVTTMVVGLVLIWQPAHWAAAWTIHRVPEYGRLVSASRLIAKHAPEVQEIRADFLHETSRADFLYTILGGRVSAEARFIATIGRDGTVTFTPADAR